jgi:hypothetical protein
METEELKRQFAELDSLWSSSPNDLDVRLDQTGESIVVTRSHYDYGIDVSIPPDGAQPGDYSDCQPYAENSFSIGQSLNPMVSGQMRSPFQSVEQVMKIDIRDARLSEEQIDERMTLVDDSIQVGRLPEVKLIGIGATGIYEVVEDYSYPLDYCSIGREAPYGSPRRRDEPDQPASHLCTVTVKSGFQFDRASIPRMFWILVSKDDLSNVAPLFHDLLYRFAGVLHPDWVKPYTTFSRREADNLFFHMMAGSGVTSWRLHVVYQAVCHFSAFAWGRQRRHQADGQYR